jgi:hypothetical protein
MYMMFLASSHDGKVNLVEWRSTQQQVEDVEEEFQRALDHWSQERPWMGDWTLIMALTTHGNKIVSVEDKPHEPNPLSDFRNKRIVAALKYDINRKE